MPCTPCLASCRASSRRADGLERTIAARCGDVAADVLLPVVDDGVECDGVQFDGSTCEDLCFESDSPAS